VVEDTDVDVRRFLGSDATAEKRLFGHVDDVADATAEGGIGVCE
jgi:hypothetical protein